MGGTCKVKTCSAAYYCSGYCTGHYKRAKRTAGRSLQPDERFLSAVVLLKDRPLTVQQLAYALDITGVWAQLLVIETGASVVFTTSTGANVYSALRSDAAQGLSLIHKRLHSRQEATADELASLCKISASSTRQYMAYLHNAGWVHVTRWLGSVQKARVWAWGQGMDGIEPMPLTSAQIAARQDRSEFTPEETDRRRSVMQRHYIRNRQRSGRDPLTAALFWQTTKMEEVA